MRVVLLVSTLAVAAVVAPRGSILAQQGPKGIRLADINWQQATDVLRPETVVVIPLGAGSKEHGPHLKLGNDAVLADYLTRRVLEASEVVVAPPLQYHFFPAFIEYPGSISLTLDTARDLTTEAALSLSSYGPRRFYVLNTGVSTVRALAPAVEMLAADGIVMRYTDILKALGPTEKAIAKQEGGTHADEIETSMILYISPGDVDMGKAVKDYHPGTGSLTRDQKAEGKTYSPTGVFGDATLATKEKGRIVTEALVDAILKELEELRKAPPPAVVPAGSVR